jgi:hypothetical protein
MNKPMTLPRLLCLTTALAAGPALMTTGVANAGVYHQHGTSHVQLRHSQPANYAKRYGLSSRFVVSGQSANVKRVLNQQNAPHEARCQTHCYQSAQTAPKGNPTLSTIAAKTAPTAHVKGMDDGPEKSRAKAGVNAVMTLSTVPAAAGLLTVPVGTGFVPTMGTVLTPSMDIKLDPITGPTKLTVDYLKRAAPLVEEWIGGW